MPIYEYACDICGHKLEKLQKVFDEPLVDCPECDAPALRKLVSAVAFRLKGSGWYETDFKDEKSQRNLAKGDEKPKEADNGKTDDAGADKEAKKDAKETTGGGGDKNTAKTKANTVKSAASGKNTTASTSPD